MTHSLRCVPALACLTAILVLPVAAHAQLKQDPVQALWAYAGQWKIDIEHFDTPYGRASHEASNLRNDCWRVGQYVSCRQEVNGESKVLLVFTCANAQNCTSYQIPPDGGDAGSGKLLIEGNSWTFPWSVTEKSGKTTWFRVVNVWTSHDTIEFRQEYSIDNEHWTRMATGHETRVGIPRMPVDRSTAPQ